MTLLVQDLDARDALGHGCGIAALANYCLDVSNSGGGIGGSDTALHRLQAFFRAHIRTRPSLPADIPWANRAALETHMNNAGPNCSPADIVTVLAGMSSGLGAPYAGVTIS